MVLECYDDRDNVGEHHSMYQNDAGTSHSSSENSRPLWLPFPIPLGCIDYHRLAPLVGIWFLVLVWLFVMVVPTSLRVMFALDSMYLVFYSLAYCIQLFVFLMSIANLSKMILNLLLYFLLYPLCWILHVGHLFLRNILPRLLALEWHFHTRMMHPLHTHFRLWFPHFRLHFFCILYSIKLNVLLEPIYKIDQNVPFFPNILNKCHSVGHWNLRPVIITQKDNQTIQYIINVICKQSLKNEKKKSKMPTRNQKWSANVSAILSCRPRPPNIRIISFCVLIHKIHWSTTKHIFCLFCFFNSQKITHKNYFISFPILFIYTDQQSDVSVNVNGNATLRVNLMSGKNSFRIFKCLFFCNKRAKQCLASKFSKKFCWYREIVSKKMFNWKSLPFTV